MFATARLLDRRRLAVLLHEAPVAPVLEALRAYRNPDGGFGHALEPDVRGPDSEPAAALHALDVLSEVGALDDPMVAGCAAWVSSIADADGGVPFVLTDGRGVSACAMDGAVRRRVAPHVRDRCGALARRRRRAVAHPRDGMVLGQARAAGRAQCVHGEVRPRLPRCRTGSRRRRRGHRAAALTDRRGRLAARRGRHRERAPRPVDPLRAARRPQPCSVHRGADRRRPRRPGAPPAG